MDPDKRANAAERKRKQRFREKYFQANGKYPDEKTIDQALDPWRQEYLRNGGLDENFFNQPPKRKVDLEEQAFLFEAQGLRVLQSIEWEDIKKASLRDRALTAGIFLDKALVIRGKPTNILRIDDRTKFNELFGELLKEAKRRGIMDAGASPHQLVAESRTGSSVPVPEMVEADYQEIAPARLPAETLPRVSGLGGSGVIAVPGLAEPSPEPDSEWFEVDLG